MKRVRPNFPINYVGSRKRIRANRVRLKPLGLTWIIATERKVERAFDDRRS